MRTALGIVVAAACALAAPAAWAGEIYIDHPTSFVNDDNVRYDAAPGENNVVSVSSHFDGHVVNLYDAGATITTPAAPQDIPLQGRTLYPCVLIDAHHAQCYVPDPRELTEGPNCPPGSGCFDDKLAGVNALAVSLGDGNNSYATIEGSDPISTHVYGGPGDDRIVTHDSPWSEITDPGGHNYIRADNDSYNRISCGGDADAVYADAMDLVESTCENVVRR
jgi:hypothetical protein